MTRKDLVDRLNRLEMALNLAHIKGDDESAEMLNDEIYAVRQELKKMTKSN